MLKASPRQFRKFGQAGQLDKLDKRQRDQRSVYEKLNFIQLALTNETFVSKSDAQIKRVMCRGFHTHVLAAGRLLNADGPQKQADRLSVVIFWPAAITTRANGGREAGTDISLL